MNLRLLLKIVVTRKITDYHRWHFGPNLHEFSKIYYVGGFNSVGSIPNPSGHFLSLT